jgi:hypothetical protein
MTLAQPFASERFPNPRNVAILLCPRCPEFCGNGLPWKPGAMLFGR